MSRNQTNSVRLCLSLLFALSPAFAAVDGVITNATTGKPAAGVTVALVEPSQAGMQSLGDTTSGAQGQFSFAQSPKGPALLQSTFQGVTYTKMLMPGTPTTGLAVDVYDATKKPVAEVSQHMILVQPTDGELNVNETFLVKGDAKLTYNDPENGTLRMYLPPGVKGSMMAQVTFGNSGIPVQRAAEKTKQENVYKINYPMRPGETRVDLTYSIPAVGDPPVFAGKILHKEGKARLVVPNGVTLKGDGIAEVGKEPQTQAMIYDINTPDFKVQVSGTGALQPEATQDDDSGAPQIQEMPPHIYDHIYWILGLSLGILALGTFLLARHSPVPAVKK